MIACGMLSDRLCRNAPERKFSLAIAYALSSCALLSLAFALPHGTPQLVVIGLGLFLAVGTSGPAGAMVANLTPQPIHGTAFAMLTLVNNLLGIAAGPLVTGLLADQLGLAKAFQLVPLISVAAAAVFYFAKRHYLADIQHVGSSAPATTASERSRTTERQQQAHDRHPFRPDLPLVLHRQASPRAGAVPVRAEASQTSPWNRCGTRCSCCPTCRNRDCLSPSSTSGAWAPGSGAAAPAADRAGGAASASTLT